MPTPQEVNFEASKLDELAVIEGLTVAEFIDQYALDSVVPAICMNEGCDFTAELEPDQREGWCEECETPSLKSGIVLAGIL
jgi:hypothetical protein